MSFAVLQAAWAEWLLEGFLAAGVRRVVVSPGSRSTPLVLAIARAEAAGRLTTEVIVDERVGAFFALGQARATGEPSLLVCTSGTAGAHYLPAIVEAAESRTPLIALTADRPPELRHRGASQTIEQRGMFGHFVRRSYEIGPAEPGPEAVDGLLRTAVLAVHAARWPDPGPVHVNAAFRKPLESDGSTSARIDELRGRVDAALAAGLRPPDLPRALPGELAIDQVAERVRAARRGLVVLGPCAGWSAPGTRAVARLTAATGFPVVPEAASQHRFGASVPDGALDVYEPLFGSGGFRERAAPDFVLQVGGAPTGRALGQWISVSGVERVVLSRHGIPEAFNQAARILVADLDPTLHVLAERLDGRGAPAVDAAWVEAVGMAARKVQSISNAAASNPGSQGQAVRTAVEAVPAGGDLVLGNSMPIRDADLYVPAAARSVRVLCQRGAAGIDGLIAGAAGSASASGRPTLLLLGDVSFQHDLGGLAAAASLDVPLVVVAVNNGGGRLFELLPVHALPGTEPVFERYFLTPPTVEITAVAEAFGVPAVRARGGDELRIALEDAFARDGATVVEAIVEPGGVDTLRRITAEIDDWIVGPEGCFPA